MFCIFQHFLIIKSFHATHIFLYLPWKQKTPGIVGVWEEQWLEMS